MIIPLRNLRNINRIGRLWNKKTKNILFLKCVQCGRQYSEEEASYVCPHCGQQGVLKVHYDYDLISARLSKENLRQSNEYSHWRYLELLPLNDRNFVPPLRVGFTPLYPSAKLGQELGVGELYIKDDTGNPTASLKDRATSVCIARCLEQGGNEIACASTGNAGASCAGFAAATGMKSYIFVPQKAPRAKIAQLLLYSATIFAVEGTYEDAFKLCQEACSHFGWYNRNTGFNPFTVEGKKTVALEICEQLGWHAPDIIIVPVGDGCIISGVWRGLCDLHTLGFIDRCPQLIAAQAEGSQAIKQALEGDGVVRPVPVNTIADSIAVSMPSNGTMAVESIRTSGGYAVAVSDEEILEAMKELGRSTGIIAEPAAAAPLAVLRKMVAEGQDLKNKRVVLLVTGSGLKDMDSAVKAGGEPIHIRPKLEEVERALHKLERRSI